MAENPQNIDTSNYQTWEKVVGESGNVYYIVPDAPGYVYDPFLSRSKGRNIFWLNPTASKKEKEDARQSAQELQDAQIDASKPVNQLIPVAGSVGGLYVANQLANGGSLFGGGASAGSTAASTAASTAGSAVGGGGGLAGAAAQGAVTGGNVPPTGALSGLGSAAPYLGLAGAGLSAYGLYNAIKAHDRNSSILSGAGLGAGLGAAAPLLGLGPLGWGGLAGMAALGAVGGFGLNEIAGLGDKDMFKTEHNRMMELQEEGFRDLPINPNPLQHGQSKEELIAQAEASGNQDAIQFAKTRDENFISPEALSTHAQLIRMAGKDATQADRFKLAQDIVAAQRANGGVLREHHGTIDIDQGQFDAWKNAATPPPANPAAPVEANPTTPPEITGGKLPPDQAKRVSGSIPVARR